MKQKGTIFEYIDKPTISNKVVDDSKDEEIEIHFQPDPVLLDAISERNESQIDDMAQDFVVPQNRPIKVIQNNPHSSFRNRLSFGFRAMLGGAVLGLIILFAPMIYAEVNFRLNPPVPQEELVLEEIEIVDSIVDTPTFAKLVNEKYVTKLDPINTEYALVIPKIGINSPVIANVDPGNKKEYNEALKIGAAHAKGTALPDEVGSKYIFAHSTDYIWNIRQYNAVFYLLKDLKPDDQVHIVYNGTLYPYKVSETRVVESGDTYYLKRNLNDNRLILQTCWPPGTTWKRLLVFAEPIDSILGSGENISYSLDNNVID